MDGEDMLWHASLRRDHTTAWCVVSRVPPAVWHAAYTGSAVSHGSTARRNESVPNRVISSSADWRFACSGKEWCTNVTMIWPKPKPKPEGSHSWLASLLVGTLPNLRFMVTPIACVYRTSPEQLNDKMCLTMCAHGHMMSRRASLSSPAHHITLLWMMCLAYIARRPRSGAQWCCAA